MNDYIPMLVCCSSKSPRDGSGLASGLCTHAGGRRRSARRFDQQACEIHGTTTMARSAESATQAESLPMRDCPRSSRVRSSRTCELPSRCICRQACLETLSICPRSISFSLRRILRRAAKRCRRRLSRKDSIVMRREEAA